MKIAILTPLFPPKHLTGLEIPAYNIAKHLAERYNILKKYLECENEIGPYKNKDNWL